MNYPLTILMAAGAFGAVDVLYFHLYRFRLFAHEGSVAEEVTHLCRHAIFLTLLVLLSAGTSSPSVEKAILWLFGLDMVNSVADVLLERRSRERLGGLPSGEYLIHILSTFGMGLAVAAYVLRGSSALPTPAGLLAWQLRMTFVAGVLIFMTEGALFARVLINRDPRAHVPTVRLPVSRPVCD